jgi:hypothetical protein
VPDQVPGGIDPGVWPSGIVSEPCSWKLSIIGTPFGRLGMCATLWRKLLALANE